MLLTQTSVDRGADCINCTVEWALFDHPFRIDLMFTPVDRFPRHSPYHIANASYNDSVRLTSHVSTCPTNPLRSAKPFLWNSLARHFRAPYIGYLGPVERHLDQDDLLSSSVFGGRPPLVRDMGDMDRVCTESK